MLTRLLRPAAVAPRSSRSFSSSLISRKDLVQDLYVKELKLYKPAPIPKDSHVGVVKSYSLPPAPTPPSLPADLAAQLSAYDASEPTKSDAPKAIADVSSDEGVSADEFLELIERDIPKPVAHH